MKNPTIESVQALKDAIAMLEKRQARLEGRLEELMKVYPEKKQEGLPKRRKELLKEAKELEAMFEDKEKELDEFAKELLRDEE